MKHLKYITEYLSNKDIDIYNKYYSDIDYDVYEKILAINPKKRIYKDWLLNLYRNNKLRLEDLYKAEKYLMVLDRPNVRKYSMIKNLKNYSSLPELYSVVSKYMTVGELDESTISETEKKCFVKKTKNYNLYIPKTYEDSVILGHGTEWCTANKANDYDNYTEDDKLLLIMIDIKDPSIKYQFHVAFDSFQFADINDNMLDSETFEEFFINNDDIFKYIVHLYNNVVYTNKNNNDIEVFYALCNKLDLINDQYPFNRFLIKEKKYMFGAISILYNRLTMEMVYHTIENTIDMIYDNNPNDYGIQISDNMTEKEEKTIIYNYLSTQKYGILSIYI